MKRSYTYTWTGTGFGFKLINSGYKKTFPALECDCDASRFAEYIVLYN